MSDAIDLLQHLGFTDYEARAYIALVERGLLSGYELAKVSGIPRPNIYPVLQKLEERAAVVRIEAPAGLRYTAVPTQELLARLGNRLHATISAAEQSLALLQRPPEQAYVWNLQGSAAILDHARSLVETAQHDLLLAIYHPEADALTKVIAEAAQRGIRISTLCLQACLHDCIHCRGLITRYRMVAQTLPRWLLIVQDASELLCVELRSNNDTNGIRTRQQMVVELASWYIRQCIALGAVLTDLGSKLETLVTPETRAILESVGPQGYSGGWLAYMRELLHAGGDAPHA